MTLVGALCAPCRAVLEGDDISPEQIVSNVRTVSRGALIDQWGRVHRIAAATRIGRLTGDESISVLTPTVSRRHALVALDDSGAWRVRDLDSSNGTFVDGEPVVGDARLRDRGQLRLGRVGFYFLGDASTIRVPTSARTISQTLRPPSEGELARATLEYEAPPSPEVVFEVEEPTGGGGAVVRVGDKHVQLTIAQYDLLLVLIGRMLDQQTMDDDVRGYVSIEDLLTRISLDSHGAAPDSVRQLVRRIRRALEKAGIGDLIESRPGRGYRLRVMPRLARRGRGE